jgi:exonuclease III
LKTFIKFNCNGIHSSKAELQDFLIKNNVKVAAIQETKLTPTSKNPCFQDYTVVHKDRLVDKGGGLAFLIHHSVRYINVDVSPLITPNDLTLEIQGISACINYSYITIFNVYIPPVCKCKIFLRTQKKAQKKYKTWTWMHGFITPSVSL